MGSCIFYDDDRDDDDDDGDDDDENEDDDVDDRDDDEEVEVEVPLVGELYGGSFPISLSHKVSLTLIIVRMMIMLKI